MARQFMRGWGANLGADLRHRKGGLMTALEALDRVADAGGLSAEEWLQQYALEDFLMEIYRGEETFWRQRSRQNWLLKGDTNPAYFHAIANGRRRKCSISCLWEDGHLLESARDISSHIYSFYKELFSAAPHTGAALAADFWPVGAMVSEDENAELTLPFLPTEVHLAIMEMKPNSAPGPDGLSVVFFKRFWGKIQGAIMPMFQELYVGTLVNGSTEFWCDYPDPQNCGGHGYSPISADHRYKCDPEDTLQGVRAQAGPSYGALDAPIPVCLP